MSRERHISYEGRKVKFLKIEFNIHMLDKIQGAIEDLKEKRDRQACITFDFGELQTLRRLLILDDMQTEFCRENMLEGMEYHKSLKE